MEADRDIASRARDLKELDQDCAELLEVYRPRLTRYRAGEYIGISTLVERMRLVHDYRLFPFHDPDLPPELLPAGWHGRRPTRSSSTRPDPAMAPSSCLSSS
ncbi:PaaX family transcriptional regulator C-terminal domain-containing protein [Streptomyces sp. 5-10]|uniref:PaaX family transcriptional regulator C-terminal domain-containing protein n=1 Tax=Streptomyces sp. 5-10 TaxID=878925 RepID=UPI001CC2AF4B